MSDKNPPTYEVVELSFEEAVLLLSSEQERYDTIFTKTSEKLMEFIAA